MKTTPAVHVHTETRGDVPKFAARLAAAKVQSLLRLVPEPVLFARVTLTMAADRAVARPATVRANVDLNGRLIHVGVAAATAREAVERMGHRLRIRLERATRNWAATRGGKQPVPLPHEWRHEKIPRSRTPYFPRPPEDRTIVQRTSYARAPQTPAEAAADLELLGFKFYLFTDQVTGQDSVIYRADGGYRMARARPGVGWPGPAGTSLTVSERPVPRLTPAAAEGRLEALGLPFVFFVNSETGRGSLVYHRYDGHYGLVVPAGGPAARPLPDGSVATSVLRFRPSVALRVAYVPGEATLWPSPTGAETLHLLARMHGETDVAYRDLLVKRFDFDTSRKVRTYSKGNRQKINLIAALASRADLLILDEPTAGLDPLMEQAFRESVLEAKDNGQTVFLSSHVLSEAEALCDRIAILRAGRLAEIGSLAQMRHLSAVTVEASFPGAPPVAVDKVAGVSAVQVAGHHLSCQLRGPIDELLTVLAAAHPDTMLSREPSLEELFLSIYGEQERRNNGVRRG